MLAVFFRLALYEHNASCILRRDRILVHMVPVEVSGVPVPAGAAPAGTPVAVVEGAFVQAATPLAITPAVTLEDVGLQAANAVASTGANSVPAARAEHVAPERYVSVEPAHLPTVPRPAFRARRTVYAVRRAAEEARGLGGLRVDHRNGGDSVLTRCESLLLAFPPNSHEEERAQRGAQ